MTNSWLPVLAGGVGGAALTNLAGEWRQWRSNRREDKHRFANERLQAAADVLRLTAELQRAHTRLIRSRFDDDEDSILCDQLRAQLSETVQSLNAAAARFQILFPSAQRVAMQHVLDSIDLVTMSIDRRQNVSTSNAELRRATEELTRSCRQFIVGANE